MKENNDGNDTNVGNMKNSIEEDIEILVAFNLAPSLKHISEDEFKDVQKAIKHILSDYKRVLKENEELKADNYELNNRITDLLENIPVQTIKDKIEELEKDEYSKYYDMFLEERDLKYTIQILQELLEESEEN